MPPALAATLILAAGELGISQHLVSFSLLEAIYARDLDISKPETVRAVLDEKGIDADSLMERAERPDMQEAFRNATDEAVAAGVFGSPAFILEGEMFFGQDRLDALAWRLGATGRVA